MPKTAKKKAAPRGNTYVLTASGKKQQKEVSGQQVKILAAISRKPLTGSEIAKQTGVPQRNVAFYLCRLRADGFVKYGK